MNSLYIIIISLVNILIFDITAIGQTGYTMRKYSIDDGLPSSEIYHAIEDKTGYIWLATDNGISKFNGYEFKNFTTFHGLTDKTVFRLYEDYRGRIWYITFKGGIGYIENDKVNVYKHNQTLIDVTQSNYLLSMTVDSAETIQFSTYAYGQGTITPNGKIDYQKITPDSTIQLCIQHNDSITKVTALRSFDLLMKAQLTISINNAPKFTTSGFINNINRIHSTTKTGVLFDFVSDNKFYLGYFSIIDSTLLTRQINNQINFTLIDKDDRLWVCEDLKGIKIFESITACFNSQPPDIKLLKGFNTSTVLIDNANGIWICNQDKGLYYIFSNAVKNYNIKGDAKSNIITSIAKTSDHSILFSTSNGYIYKFNASGDHELVFKYDRKINSINLLQNEVLRVGVKSILKKGTLQKPNNDYSVSTYKGSHFY